MSMSVSEAMSALQTATDQAYWDARNQGLEEAIRAVKSTAMSFDVERILTDKIRGLKVVRK